MSRLERLYQMISELDASDYGKGFAAEYYVPFVREVAGRKFTAAMAAAALGVTKSAEIDDWSAKHREDVNAFAALAKSYAWPRVRPKLPDSGEPEPEP